MCQVSRQPFCKIKKVLQTPFFFFLILNNKLNIEVFENLKKKEKNLQQRLLTTLKLPSLYADSLQTH